MSQHILIAGSGFAGTWAALAAVRAIHDAGRSDDIRVTVVSPSPTLVIRPRLYEAVLEGITPDLRELFAATGIHHISACIEQIDPAGHCVTLDDGSTLTFDKLVLATGSRLQRPPLPGLAEHGFSVDQLEDAQRLQAHLQALAQQPYSEARNTVVVAGAGFTGIETAAEMPQRLRELFNDGAQVRVLLLEQAAVVGPELGEVPRPVIEQALADCGVETMTGTSLSRLTADSLTTSDGEQIACNTLIWTAGVRAQALVQQLPGQHDAHGRLHSDAWLRAPQAPDIFVTGDQVRAASDDQGNVAVMSCQHALSLGRVAGYNAAAELLGLPLHPYSQPKYVTCLDIGSWGALYTEGWDRQILLTGDEGKQLKHQICTEWIYPPAAERAAAFATANPDFVIVP